MERCLRWGSLASPAGKREKPRGVGGTPRWGGRSLSVKAHGPTPHALHCPRTRPGEALPRGGPGTPLHREATEAFLSDSQHII